MKQDKEFRKHRERLKEYLSFLKTFGKTENGFSKGSNLYSKLSGQPVNGKKNPDLSPEQVKEIKAKLIRLQKYIFQMLNLIEEWEKEEEEKKRKEKELQP